MCLCEIEATSVSSNIFLKMQGILNYIHMKATYIVLQNTTSPRQYFHKHINNERPKSTSNDKVDHIKISLFCGQITWIMMVWLN